MIDAPMNAPRHGSRFSKESLAGMRQQTLKSMHLAAVLRSPGSHKPNDGVIPEAVPTSDWQIWRGKAGGAIFPCDEWKMLGWDRVLLLLIAYYAFCAAHE